MPGIEIKPFSINVCSDLVGHFQRHRSESGQDGVHFMPFVPNDPDGPIGISVEKSLLPLDMPGWQRWFYARDNVSGLIIGHVDLKNDGIRSGLHRCELGIGIERAYRGIGLGKQLMTTAIEFVRSTESLAWIDLRVFANNTRALALYQQLGFVEVGMLKDRFRIEGKSIDDILMTLKIA